MDKYIVVMGVAGCGKSSLGAALAQAEGLQDSLYRNTGKGTFQNVTNCLGRTESDWGVAAAFFDYDRDGWLDILGEQLQAHPGGMVLTCSALKRRYRDRLRQARPGLRFVFLDIDRDDAQARVVARSATHFFSTSLVDSQFATLESPVGEPGVWRADARLPLAQLQGEASAWLNKEAFA